MDPVGLEWEGAFVDLMGNVSVPVDRSKLQFMAARRCLYFYLPLGRNDWFIIVVVFSFGDISGATILGDVRLLTAGVIVVFMYVQLMLGKFNMVEQRVSSSF